jgi:putative transposase
MGLVHECLENGRQVRILGVLDTFTRECLLLKAAPFYRSSDVKHDLEWLFLLLGKPDRIRTDNGPEFRTLTLPAPVEHGFIQPGSPTVRGQQTDYRADPRLTIYHRTPSIVNAF